MTQVAIWLPMALCAFAALYMFYKAFIFLTNVIFRMLGLTTGIYRPTWRARGKTEPGE